MAGCALLSQTLEAQQSPNKVEVQPWKIDSGLLLYSESGRVSAVEPALVLKREQDNGAQHSLKLVLDLLTGASANGAVPSQQVQTFSSPSGESQYTVQPNETPLDTSFHDARLSLSSNWLKIPQRNHRLFYGVQASREYDFTSVSGNVRWELDKNRKNTSWNLGANLELDLINPVGGTPVGGSDTALKQRRSSDEDRQVLDLILGLTQIIDRRSLLQLNLSLSQADGYMTDPYKFLSVLDAQGVPQAYRYENRPDQRQRQSLFGLYRRTLENDAVINLSARLMSDDWGVQSQTLDAQYRLNLSNDFFLQPHVRWYQQSAADFYRYFLTASEAIPAYLSADYRLGEMQTQTLGVKLGQQSDADRGWSLSLERYIQNGESHPALAVGQLQNQDLFPQVTAWIVQLNYSLLW